MNKAESPIPVPGGTFTHFPPWTMKPIACSSSSSSTGQVPVPVRGQLYCLQHFLANRVPHWHQSEVSRQRDLCGAAVDKLHRDRIRCAVAKNQANPKPKPRLAVRTQPRRAVRQKRRLEELLAEKARRPNRKLLEGEYVLAKADVAEALYTNKYRVEAAESTGQGAHGHGFQMATLVFVERLKRLIEEKKRELAGSGPGPAPRLSSWCAVAMLNASCPCCRTSSVTVQLPPLQPDAVMIPTPSLGNWPTYTAKSSARSKSLGRSSLSSIVENAQRKPAAKITRQAAQENIATLDKDDCTRPKAAIDQEEDVEAAIVTVSGLRFAVDFCDGDKIVML